MSIQEYNEKVDRVSRLSPRHPLLPSLLKGYSKINLIYLDKALKTLPAPPPAPARPDSLKLLYVRKSALFGRRASLSNKMCDLPDSPKNDKARARIIDEILDVQREIEEVFERIEILESGGDVVPEDVDLPADKSELLKKRLSLRSAISRARKKNSPTLSRLEKQLSDVERAIASC